MLDGDGSLLMNLGSLVTIANAAPENLVHFVCENGCYEANGEHPIPGKDVVSFATIARGAGYRNVADFSGLEQLKAGLPALMTSPGPNFATLRVKPGVKPTLDYSLVHGHATQERFQAALARELQAR